MRVRFYSCSGRSRILRDASAPLARALGSRGLLAALLLPFLLSGCLVQSKIQGRYIDDQADCRSEAEHNIGRYQGSAHSKKDRDAQLVTLFSDCMGKHGWQVGKPKKVATTNGPAGPLDPYGRGGTGAASGAVAGAAAATAAKQQQQPQQADTQAPQPGKPAEATQQPSPAQEPVATQSTVLSPGGGQAPLNPPAEVQPPAVYQPARPTLEAPAYGTGAGRNF